MGSGDLKLGYVRCLAAWATPKGVLNKIFTRRNLRGKFRIKSNVEMPIELVMRNDALTWLFKLMHR